MANFPEATTREVQAVLGHLPYEAGGYLFEFMEDIRQFDFEKGDQAEQWKRIYGHTQGRIWKLKW